MHYKKYSNFKNEMSMEEFGALFSTDQNKIDIKPSNALKNSDVVYACVNYIASTIAKMPLNLYANTEEGKMKIDNDLSYLLKNRPNAYMNSVDFIQALVSNMLIYGNAFAKVITNRGKITELILLEPSNTRLENVKNKWVVVTTINGKQEILNYNQVIHIRDLSEDGVRGISRVEAIKGKVSNRTNADNKLNRYMSNGLGVKGVITGKIDDNKAKIRLKEGFNKVLQSCDDNIAVLTEGMTYQNINSSSLADDEFINNLKLTKADICAIFNINPALLGDSEQATNSNLETLKLDFIQSLLPLLIKIEQEFNYKLLSYDDRLKTYFKFNSSSAMRGNDKDRADYYTKMFRNGFITQDEIRALEDMNNLPDNLGENFYRDLNLVECKWALAYQLGKAGVENPTK